MGGVFTDNLTWRWCFWINLPFGAITIVGIAFLLKHPDQPENKRPFKEKLKEVDYIGPIFFIPAIVCLLLALQYGGITDPWLSAKVLGLIAVTVGLLPIWFYTQLRLGERATVPPRIFFQRTVFFGSLFSFFLGGSGVILNFFLPLYFQAVRGSSAFESGIQILPLIISTILSAVLGGMGMSLVGYVMPFMVLGGAVYTVGAGLLTMLSVDTPFVDWVIFQAIAGAGLGMNLQVSISSDFTNQSLL